MKWLLYRLGVRPKPGSVFYSPTLAYKYAFGATDIIKVLTANAELVAEALEKINKEQQNGR